MPFSLERFGRFRDSSLAVVVYPTVWFAFPWKTSELRFHSGFLAQDFDSHVKCSADQSFISGGWVSKIF
jgi:hypothetical protein